MLLTRTATARLRDPDEGLESYEADTARLWVSDRQWMALLERVERGPDEADGENFPDYAQGESDATGDRAFARHALNFRAMLRLAPPQKPADDHGTYLVHSRNISSGGLGFVHTQPMRPGTRCTVALQPQHGRGMILAARVAWSRLVDRDAEDSRRFDVGIQFDRPIDLSLFVPAA